MPDHTIQPIPHHPLLTSLGLADLLPSLPLRRTPDSATHLGPSCPGTPLLASLLDLRLDPDCATCTTSSLPPPTREALADLLSSRHELPRLSPLATRLSLAERFLTPVLHWDHPFRRLFAASPYFIETTALLPALSALPTSGVMGLARTLLLERASSLLDSVAALASPPEVASSLLSALTGDLASLTQVFDPHLALELHVLWPELLSLTSFDAVLVDTPLPRSFSLPLLTHFATPLTPHRYLVSGPPGLLAYAATSFLTPHLSSPSARFLRTLTPFASSLPLTLGPTPSLDLLTTLALLWDPATPTDADLLLDAARLLS